MTDTAPVRLAELSYPGRFLRTVGFPYGKAALIIAFQFATTIFEGAGVATLIPLFELTAAGGDVAAMTEQSRLWTMVADLFDRLGLPLKLYSLLTVLFLLVLCRQGLKAVTQIYYSKVQNECIRDARVLGFSRALAARIGYHDDSVTGDIVNDLITDMERAMGVVFGVVYSVGSIILLTAYMTIITAVTSWSIIAMIAIIIFFGLILQNIFRRSLQTSEVIARLNRDLSTFLIEKLQSIRLIRLSGAQTSERKALSDIASDLCERRVHLVHLATRVPLIVEPMAFIMVMTFMVVSTTVFGLKFEIVFVVLGLLARLLPVVQELATTCQGILSAWGSLDSVDERLQSLDTAKEETGGGHQFTHLARGIEVENVGFRYDMEDRQQALNGISMIIPAGRLTALVGPSGAGKSTLVDVLARLRDPNEGQVLFDGRPARDFNVESLRDGIAFVPQDPQIFNQTIAEHIRYGHPGATDGEVEAAARLAGATEFIADLAQRYDTMVGEFGVRLSGGQRQRLDLARAVARHHPILILDEPASGLDAHSQEHLQQALLRIRQETDTTIILIAHGFSMVVDADQIVVLEAGRIVGQGTHDQLMTQGGWYAQAFEKQFRGVLRAGNFSAIS